MMSTQKETTDILNSSAFCNEPVTLMHRKTAGRSRYSNLGIIQAVYSSNEKTNFSILVKSVCDHVCNWTLPNLTKTF